MNLHEKAIALHSFNHNFEDGEEITLIGMDYDEEEWYVFRSDSRDFVQHLRKNHFCPIIEPSFEPVIDRQEV